MDKFSFPTISQERDVSTYMSLALALQGDHETYSGLIRYLQGHEQLDPIPVEDQGNCMFSSIRRAIDVPFEYQNIHLRRQIVMTLANHCNCFMPLLKNSIMATYGHPRMEEDVFIQRCAAGELTQQQINDQECPGSRYKWRGLVRFSVWYSGVTEGDGSGGVFKFSSTVSSSGSTVGESG